MQGPIGIPGMLERDMGSKKMSGDWLKMSKAQKD